MIRAGLASSMLVGIIVGRRIVGVPTLVNVDLETSGRARRAGGSERADAEIAACRTLRELVAASTRRTEREMTLERGMPNWSPFETAIAQTVV